MTELCSWEKFKVGYLIINDKKVGKGLFQIINSVPYHNKDIIEIDDGLTYITRSKFNNGMKCKVKPNDTFAINPAKTISFGAENANFFYQKEEYITGNKMYYLDTRELSEYSAIFLQSVLGKTFTDSFSFVDGLIPTRIYDEDILLPATPSGDPDWEYMENYMRQMEEKAKERLQKLEELRQQEKRKIDVSGWGEFHLYDLFEVSMGNKFDKSKMNDFEDDVNFIGRSALNNGVACSVSFVKGKDGKSIAPYKAGDITIALGGSIGSCFIQNRDFYTSQNVCVLHNNVISDYSKRFIVTSIYASCANYEAFVDELNRHIKTDFIIKLPITPAGEPDWEYMENYMRQMEEKAKKRLHTLEDKRKRRFKDE